MLTEATFNYVVSLEKYYTKHIILTYLWDSFNPTTIYHHHSNYLLIHENALTLPLSNTTPLTTYLFMIQR